MGYVYVLSNAGMTNILKIGQTSGSHSVEWINLARRPAYQTPSSLRHISCLNIQQRTERRLHAALANHRRPGKEFFDLALDSALAHGKEVLGKKAQYIRNLHGPFKEP